MCSPPHAPLYLPLARLWSLFLLPALVIQLMTLVLCWSKLLLLLGICLLPLLCPIPVRGPHQLLWVALLGLLLPHLVPYWDGYTIWPCSSLPSGVGGPLC